MLLLMILALVDVAFSTTLLGGLRLVLLKSPLTAGKGWFGSTNVLISTPGKAILIGS
jgi:hypothetical protein